MNAVSSVRFSGHPTEGVDGKPFTLSATNPTANDHPHYDNGVFHLYVSGGCWRVQALFDPASNGCWSFISPAQDALPEGAAEWTCFVDGAWKKTHILLKIVRDSRQGVKPEIAKRDTGPTSNGKQQVQDHIDGLEFSSHPMEAVNAQAFTLSTTQPSANGKPHYENGTYHLYFSDGCWRVTAAFDPTSTRCWSFISPTKSGDVPDGEHAWTTNVNEKWVQTKISLTWTKIEIRPDVDCQAVIAPFFSSTSDEKKFLSSDPIDAINAECAARGARFVDADFPPLETSVNQPGDIITLDVDSWTRLSDLCQQPEVFDESMHDDVQQGTLGDCYLCAILANMCISRPALLKQVFSQRAELNTHGCYSLRLCDPRSREWKYVVVDDYVPIKHGQPTFLTSKNVNELWCSLLEKGLAKLAGSYSRLDARGKPMKNIISSFGTKEVMELLTGCIGGHCFIDFECQMPEDVWAQLCTSLTYKWPTTTGCKETEEGQLQEEEDEASGLVHHHSYSVLGAVEMPCGDRLVRVRNPWGMFEWQGKWADDDTENWTVEAKELVAADPIGGGELVARNDGAFFLPLQDFLREYRGLEYCRIDNGDELWWQYMETVREAKSLQREATLILTGHPMEPANATPYKVSEANPEANEHPHYENGTFHLYFVQGCWRLQNIYDPSSAGCYSYILPVAAGLVPEGERQWTTFFDGEWKKTPLKIITTAGKTV